MIRLFTSIGLPEQYKNKLHHICYGIRYAKWVKKEDLHLTICFMGEIEEHQLEETQEILQAIKFSSFDLKVKGVGFFKKRHKPITLWAGVDQNDQLKDFHQKIVNSLRSINIPIENKHFSPHITLARVPKINEEKLAQYLEQHTLFELPSYSIDSFRLIKSKLTEKGPIYTILREYDLIK